VALWRCGAVALLLAMASAFCAPAAFAQAVNFTGNLVASGRSSVLNMLGGTELVAGGLISAIPLTCSNGQVYLAIDQVGPLQWYVCDMSTTTFVSAIWPATVDSHGNWHWVALGSVTANGNFDGNLTVGGTLTVNGGSGLAPLNLPPIASPSSPSAGDIWVNSTDNLPSTFDGTNKQRILTASNKGLDCFDASGSGTTYTCNVPDYPSAPSGSPWILYFRPQNTSTAAATLAVNSGTGLPIYKYTSVPAGLNGDLQGGTIYPLQLNNGGTGWVIAGAPIVNIPASKFVVVDPSDQTKVNTFSNECPASTTCGVSLPGHSGILLSGGSDTQSISSGTLSFGSVAVAAIHQTTLNANITTLTVPNGLADGESMCFVFTHDATSTTYTIAAPSNIQNLFAPGGVASQVYQQCGRWNGTAAAWLMFPTNVVPASNISGVVARANGGLGGGMPGTGILRDGSPTSTSELSGDASTSGSNSVTVVKVNGGSVPASAAVLASNGSSQLTAATSTGSGGVVLATSPTLTTPNIGAANGTSLMLAGNDSPYHVVGNSGTPTSPTCLSNLSAATCTYVGNDIFGLIEITTSGTAVTAWSSIQQVFSATFAQPGSWAGIPYCTIAPASSTAAALLGSAALFYGYANSSSSTMKFYSTSSTGSGTAWTTSTTYVWTVNCGR
jgi:hypothetical protein